MIHFSDTKVPVVGFAALCIFMGNGNLLTLFGYVCLWCAVYHLIRPTENSEVEWIGSTVSQLVDKIPGSIKGIVEPSMVYAIHPHGAMCIGALRFLGMRKIKVLVSSVWFKLPIARELAIWSGCVNASVENIDYYLKNGCSVVIYPAGVSETKALFTKNKYCVGERSKLFVRKDWTLVPCYSHGENEFATPIVTRWTDFQELLFVTLGMVTPMIYKIDFDIPINVRLASSIPSGDRSSFYMVLHTLLD